VAFLSTQPRRPPADPFRLHLHLPLDTAAISQSLDEEVQPFGVRSVIFEPGYFRTRILDAGNRAVYAPRVEAYAPALREIEQMLAGA
jgi:hypothetical protein